MSHLASRTLRFPLAFLVPLLLGMLWLRLAAQRPADGQNPSLAGPGLATAPGPVFALELPPERLPAGGWRWRWSSIPGRRYLLQRWTSDDLGVAADPAWSDLAMVVATGTRATAEDPSAVQADRRFYRVVLLDDEGTADRTPPTLSSIDPRYVSPSNQPAARLSVSATDNVGVERVEFFNGTLPLGRGIRGTDGRWSLVLPLDTRQLGARFLVARAYDAAGNFANSPVFPLGLVDPDHFVPLGSDGQPVEGGIVPAVTQGAWGPVEFRPGGRDLFGRGAGFFLRFPQGVRLLQVDNQPVLEFTNVVAGFSAGYPLQLRAPLVRTSGGPRRLAVQQVSLAQVLPLFDLDPEQGITVRLFDRFELQWRAGTLEQGLLAAARFSLPESGLPLPAISGDYPEWHVDFSEDSGVRLPFHGEFPLPDGSRIPARIRVPRESPLWLTLHPDGRLSLAGSAGVELGNGGAFRADLRLDDPHYQLSIAAERLRIASLGSLAGFLPSRPSECLPAPSPGDGPSLGQAADCLESLAEAYQQFTAALTATGVSADTDGAVTGVPPEPLAHPASGLEAWALAALAGTTGSTLPFDAVLPLVRHAGASAAGSHDLEAAARSRLALYRLARAVTLGRFTGGDTSRAEVDASLAEADAAVLIRLEDPEAAKSSVSLAASAALLTATEPLRQALGRPADSAVPTALGRALQRLSATGHPDWGVLRPGEFTPASNPVLSRLPLPAAAAHLRDLMRLLVAAGSLGVDASGTLLDEAVGQLASHVATRIATSLAEAEAEGDYPRFLGVLPLLVELVEHHRAGVFPQAPGLASIPVAADLPGVVSRLGTLLGAEEDQPLGERSLGTLATEIRLLHDILQATPGTLPVPLAALRRPYDQLEARLAESLATTVLTAETRVSTLSTLLEAGTLHAQYARRIGLSQSVDWESVRLPRVAAVLATRATEAGAWSELDRAARLLLKASRHPGLTALPTARRAHLEQAARLLAGSHAVAQAAQRRATASESMPPDLALPGAIEVTEAAGSVRYDRVEGRLEGSFRGTLGLPRFGTRLSIHRARLGSAGLLDLEASGDLRVPQDTPFLSASVPATQPFRLQWSAADGLRLSGGANVTLANGMFFRGSLGLEDPLYRFHLEAGGLQVQLARALASAPPAFPADGEFVQGGTLDEAALENWTEYLGHLGATLGGFGLGPTPPAPAPGALNDLPGNTPPPADPGLAAFQAWARLQRIESRFGTGSNALASLPTAAAMFSNLAQAATAAPQHIDDTLNPAAAGRALAGPAASPSVTLAGTLQIDLGSLEPTVPAAGPAQDFGRFIPGTTSADIVLPDLPGSWNATDGAGTAPLLFADGTPAPGITVRAGPGFNSDSFRRDATRPPAVRALFHTPPLAGVYATDLLEDAVTGHNGATETSSLVIQVRGLPPGDYLVFSLLAGVTDGGRRYSVHAGGSGADPVTWDRARLELPRLRENVQTWQEGANFTRTRVRLLPGDEELVVVCRSVGFLHTPGGFEFSEEPGSESSFTEPPFVDVPGELSGLQIIPVRPSILSFTASPDRVELGQRSRLSWSVRNARQVVITGTDGFRFESSSGADEGFVDVSSSQVTTYTLTASNANNTPATATRVVQAVGSSTLTKAAADAAQDFATIKAGIQDLANAAAECELRGGTNCPDISAALCGSVGTFLDNLRATLLDCEAVKGRPGSRDLLLQAIRDVLDVTLNGAADGQLAGCAENPEGFTLGDVTRFATCVLGEFYRRTGADVVVVEQPDGELEQTATLHPEIIDAFTVAESVQVLRQLLDLQASLDLAGAGISLVEPHLRAHAGNIARRITAETPPAGAGSDPRLGRTESELSSYLDGILLLHAASSKIPEIPTLPADLILLVSSHLLDRIAESVDQAGFFSSFQSRFDRAFWLPYLETFGRLRQLQTIRPTLATELELVLRPLAQRAAEDLRDGTELSTEMNLSEFLQGRGSAELRPRDVRALQRLIPFLPDDVIAGHLRHRLELALRYIADRIPLSSTLSLDELRRRVDFVPQLADVQLLLAQAKARTSAGTGTIDPPSFLLPLTLGSNLLARARASAVTLGAEEELVPYSRAVFEVRRNLRLSQSTLVTPSPAPASETPAGRTSRRLQAGAAALTDPGLESLGAGLVRLSQPLVRDASSRLATQARRLVTDPPPGLPGDFKLPSNLRVDRVFGEFDYNRLTGFLRGGFGGDLAFPDAGLTASIREASVASDGSFTVDASTAGPLPFGRIRLESGFRLEFVTNLGTRLQGSGRLLIPSATSTQTLAVAVQFEEASRRLGFQVADRNLQLPLSEDFVLFDVGGGLTSGPEGAGVRLSGSVGLVARSKPLPASLSRSNFLLTVDDAVVSLLTRDDALEVRLEGGVLRLPDHFSAGACPTNPPGAAVGPAISLNAQNPIVLTLPVPGRGTPSFRGELAFSRLGLRVPGLTNLTAEICTATLQFPSNALPRLSRVHATLGLVLPSGTNHIDLVDATWGLDGFPTGTLAVRETLPLFQQAGFEFALLGTASPSASTCPGGTALSIARNPDGSPFFRLDGAVEFAMPADMVGTTNGGRLFTRSCGFLAGGPGRDPQLALETLAVGGSFRLGGAQGLLIENGSITLQGLTNLFRPTPSRPFVLSLQGQASIPSGPRLGLQDARFEFIGDPLPRFTVRGLSLAQNPTLEAVPGLPIQITAASLQFFNPGLPLPALLHPTNLLVGLSATVSIPPGPDPLLTGIVQGLSASLRNGNLEASVNGLGIRFVDFEVPPLSLTGEVFLGGLRPQGASATAETAAGASLAGPGLQAAPDGPFFAGRVGGTLDGIGIKALFAFDLQGPIGICLDGSAGPAGIPLGPTGFLLTGVQGGVSFLNTNGDPCDFATFIPLDANGRPAATPNVAALQGGAPSRPPAAMSWEQYRHSLARQRLAAKAERRLQAGTASAGSPSARVAVLSGPSHPELAAEAPEFPCPTGDCPPASVNILCQPHPDTERFPDAVILKFSALGPDDLDRFGITRSLVEGFGTTPSVVADGVATRVRDAVSGLIPRADPALLGNSLANDLNRAIEEQLTVLRTQLAGMIVQALGGNAGGSIYDRVVATAARGVGCPDATVKLTGTFSHAAVSTALSGTVGVVYSSAGSAGLVGSLNLTGIPVGTVRSFVNLTDAQGLPNPSYCGDARFALGPVEFGQLRAKFECPGCVTGFLGAFGELASCLGETQTRAVLSRVAPRLEGQSVTAALSALTDQEKLAFAAHVFSQPPVPGLAGCWRDAARGALEGFAPSYVLCGAAQPRIFGIPLGDSALEINAGASRSGIAAGLSFSPSFIVNNLALCGASIGTACSPIFPALDSATFGFSLGFPDPIAASLDALDGRLHSPEALADFVRDGFDHLLANSTITLGYQLNPFGFKLADGEGRAVLPNLTAHPARPGAPAFRTPEERGLPSRLALLLGALQSDLLANPLWKGTAEDIHLAFPAGSPERAALQGRGFSFANDYFPHGGFLGAGRIAMPKLLVDAPPAALGVVFDGSRDPLTRLGAAAEVVGNHLLQTSNLGTLAFYVPAPNPPLFSDAEGQPLDPKHLLEAIGTFDIAVPNLANPYPFQVAFLRGELDGRLIGIPVARATVEAQPATGSNPAFFRVTGSVPTDSWLRSFLAEASMAFEIRQAPPLPIDVFFGSVQSNLQRLAAQSAPTPAAVLDAVHQLESGLAEALPKVSLELQVSNLRIPDPLTNLLTTASASAGVFAYSPRFAPGTPGTNPVAKARRDGGIAFRGAFRFADLVSITNAELAVLPKLNPLEPPALSGLLEAPRIALGGLDVHDTRIAFNTEPAPGEPFFRAQGAIDPFSLPNPLGGAPILTFRPLSSGANRIAARVDATRSGPNTVAASLHVDPASLDFPTLGPGLAIRVHGATTQDPFTFSTTEDWTAAVSVVGALSLRDPLNQELLRVGAAGQSFSATLSGRGLAFRELLVRVPGRLDVTVFPSVNLPSDIPRTYRLGAGEASLRISASGTFALDASLGGSLQFPSLPAPALAAGASVSITQSRLLLTGSFTGGLLAAGTSANAAFTLDSQGRIALSGQATLPPQAFGSLQLQGVSSPELQVALFHDGYAVPNGARLRIAGVASELLALSPFTNRANLDFTARVTSGDFNVPNAFRVTGGRMELRRRSGTVSFDIDSTPDLILLPGSDAQNRISAPFTSLSVSTDGRFYADSGTRSLALPGAIVLSGRLEIGNEPGTGTPSLLIDATSLDFGATDLGSVGTRSIRLRNDGNVPLVVSLTSTSGDFIPTLTDVSLAVGRAVEVPVEFRPVAEGLRTAQLQVFLSPGGSRPAVGLSGSGVAVPILGQNPTQLDFGNTTLGKPRVRTLTVRNLGTAPLVLSQASLPAGFGIQPSVKGQSIAPGGSLAFDVTYAPTSIGISSGTLTLTANTRIGTHSTSLSGLGFTERWILVHQGGASLRAAAFRDSTTGWAVGDSDTLLQTTDGGHSWRRIQPGFGGDFRAIDVAGDLVVIAGEEGTVGVSTDAGASWTRLTDALAAAPTNHWEAVAIRPANPFASAPASIMLAGSRASGGGIVARQTTSGFVVAAQPAEALHALAQHRQLISQAGRFIAVGDGGRVLRSTDGGTNWSSTTVAPRLPLRGVALSTLLTTDSDPRVLAVGDGGVYLRSTTFTGSLSRSIFTLRDYQAAVPSLAVGRDGLATRVPPTTSPSFESIDPEGAYDLHGAATSDAGTFAVGEQGQIWLLPPTPPTGPFLSLSEAELDFGTQPLGTSRLMELVVANRGVSSLDLGSLTLSGSSAFTVNTSKITGIRTNGTASVLVRFTPTTLGRQAATLEIASNDSATRYRIPLSGHSQANEWPVVSTPGTAVLADLQMSSDTLVFAATSSTVFRSTDAGTNWTAVVNAPGVIRRLHFPTSLLGFAVGGELPSRFSSFPPCTNDCQSFILRTSNGGGSWSSRATGVSTRVSDIEFGSSSTGYAVTRSESDILGRVTAGDVLKTSDGGLTWTRLPRPVPSSGSFDGTAVEATSSTVVFVSSGAELFRSIDGGASWTRVLSTGGNRINDIMFPTSSTGFLVGDGGLLRRTTLGGATSSAWTTPSSFTTANLSRVHFVGTSLGWISGAEGSIGVLFRSANGGLTWVDEIRKDLAAGDRGPGAITARTTSRILATDGADVVRSSPVGTSSRGSLVLPALEDLGTVALGNPVSGSVLLRNLGPVGVTISEVTLSDTTGTDAFELSGIKVPFAVPASGSVQLGVRFRANVLGRHAARLVVTSDGHEPAVAGVVVATAAIFPTPVNLLTEPPGLLIRIDSNRTATGPTTLTVVGPSTVPNDVINPFEWRFGTVHTLEAPATQTLGGFEYAFQGWEPSQPGTSLTVLATNIPTAYRAIYVPVRPVPTAGGTPALAADPRLAGPPADVGVGPYVRVSGARLRLPGLGEPAVSGAAFLASDRFQFTLANSPLGDPSLVSVSAGSWRVSYTNAPFRFVVRAASPGLTILNTPANPASEVLFDITPTAINAQIETRGQTPVVPGIAEIGPSRLAFSSVAQGSARFSSFSTTTSLRALPLPSGGYAMTSSLQFRASDGPFTNRVTQFPSFLVNTPLFSLRPAASPLLEIRRDASGNWGMLLTNFTASLAGGAATPVSGSLQGTRLTLGTGRTLGLGSLVYNADAAGSLEWNFAGPTLRTVLPAGTLSVPGIASGVRNPQTLVLDSAGDFDLRLPLPGLSFNGIGINAGGALDHNFIRFHREDGIARFQIRDRRSFFGNTFRLALDVNTAGSASGSFSGELVVRDFLGCEEIGLGDISLRYSNQGPFQFSGRVRGTLCSDIGADFNVQFGSGGSRLCHLICLDGCNESVCLTTP